MDKNSYLCKCGHEMGHHFIGKKCLDCNCEQYQGEVITNSLCIFCGLKLNIIESGYKCVHCNLQWSLSEHKDNQNWAVRHIRALEARVQQLETALDILLKKLGV